QRDPFARAELRWIELRRDLLVFRNRNFLFVHYPFALTQDAVHSPMDEHSELCILKPLASSLVGRTRSVGGVTRRLRALRLALFLRRSRHLGWPHDTCKEHHKDQATRVQQAIAETRADPLTDHEHYPFDQVRNTLRGFIKYLRAGEIQVRS